MGLTRLILLLGCNACRGCPRHPHLMASVIVRSTRVSSGYPRSASARLAALFARTLCTCQRAKMQRSRKTEFLTGSELSNVFSPSEVWFVRLCQ
jgi:hypothetical protein